MLAISVYGAMSHALKGLGDYPKLNTPMTAEHLLMTANRLRAKRASD